MVRSALGLAVMITLARVAAAEPVVRPTCGDPPAKPTKTRTVRDVDWCNFDYGGMKGGLRRGHNELHLYSKMGEPDAPPHDTIADSLEGVVYGDLDGDKRPEAVVVIAHTTVIGRTGAISTGMGVHVYSLVGSKPKRIADAPAGGPVRDITIARRSLTITSGPDTAPVASSYHLAGGKLTQVP